MNPSAQLAAGNQEFETGVSPPSNFTEGTEYRIACKAAYFWADGNNVTTISCYWEMHWTVAPTCTRTIL